MSLVDGCPHIVKVNMSATNITDLSLEKIATKYLGLLELDIGHCKMITDKGMGHLASCSKLERLSMKITPLVTDAGTLLVASSCSSRSSGRWIKSKTPHLTLAMLTTGCPRIQKVQFGGRADFENVTQLPDLNDLIAPPMLGNPTTMLMTTTGMASIGNCSNLVRLDIDFNSLVIDDILASIGAGCLLLKEISIRYSAVSVVGIKKLVLGCPLTKLGIGDTAATDQWMVAISKGAKRLEILDIRSTKVTDTGLRKLKSGCPRLVEVNTRGCEAVSPEGKILFGA